MLTDLGVLANTSPERARQAGMPVSQAGTPVRQEPAHSPAYSTGASLPGAINSLGTRCSLVRGKDGKQGGPAPRGHKEIPRFPTASPRSGRLREPKPQAATPGAPGRAWCPRKAARPHDRTPSHEGTAGLEATAQPRGVATGPEGAGLGPTGSRPRPRRGRGRAGGRVRRGFSAHSRVRRTAYPCRGPAKGGGRPRTAPGTVPRPVPPRPVDPAALTGSHEAEVAAEEHQDGVEERREAGHGGGPAQGLPGLRSRPGRSPGTGPAPCAAGRSGAEPRPQRGAGGGGRAERPPAPPPARPAPRRPAPRRPPQRRRSGSGTASQPCPGTAGTAPSPLPPRPKSPAPPPATARALPPVATRADPCAVPR